MLPGGGIGDKPKSTAQTASAPQSQTKDKDNDTDNGSRTETASAQNSESDPHHLPRVTGIRHWSTPDYTRVAIDLESEVAEHLYRTVIAEANPAIQELVQSLGRQSEVHRKHIQDFAVQRGFLPGWERTT